jgi:DNA-binding NtrC family response regulator
LPFGGSIVKALVVEDQPAVAQALCVLLQMHDIPCLSVSSPEQALRVLDTEPVGLVIQDMNFTPGATSGREGIELFRRLRAQDPELPVLALTAWTSLETAVQMVKEGASDYLAKPWDDAKLLAAVRTLLDMRMRGRASARPGAALREQLAREHDLRDLVYESDAMHRVVSLAVQVAGADVPVLITGPNGVGKEKLAEIVQANSRRRDKPFLKVNAGALPDELLESELFGAEAGAFTGAVKRRVGRFDAADGGTLFLDEIGNLSPAGQAKLLRVLQSGEFERLGSSETRRVDVRVLAATNADLRDALQQGLFRQDLFFRLNVIELAVPALKDRRQDVLPLAERSLRQLATPATPGRRFSEAARAALMAHDWPGNVRELMNRVQRATLVAGAGDLEPEDLGLGGMPSRVAPAVNTGARGADDRRRIEQLLLETNGSVSQTAERLGLSRQALYRRMEKLGISLERRPRS